MPTVLVLIAACYLLVAVTLSLRLARGRTFTSHGKVGKQVLLTLACNLGCYVFVAAMGSVILKMVEPTTCFLFENGNFIGKISFWSCLLVNLEVMLLLLVTPFLIGLMISIPIVAWKAAAELERVRANKSAEKQVNKAAGKKKFVKKTSKKTSQKR